MKKAITFLMALVLMGSFLAVPVSAWDVDEVYEHNRRVRAELEALEMCDELREFFLLPAICFIGFTHYWSFAQISALDSFPDKITALAQEITDGLTGDYEKARAISFWVGWNISYSIHGRRGQDALSVLENGHAVCEGYSNLTVTLLRSVGIPAIYVAGAAGDGLHAWVEAFVDERWIIIEPTWMPTRMFGTPYSDLNRFFDMSLREISRYSKYTVDFYIPSFINGLSLLVDEDTGMILTSLRNSDDITELIIPGNFTVFDDSLRLQRALYREEALRPFPNLERLVLPEGFTTLNSAVFSQSSLSEVVFPESLERIGSGAFTNTNLETIVLPDNLESIGRGAFDNAELYAVYIPPATTDISSTAFDNNPFLTIYVHQGTAAESFAFHNGIPFAIVGSVPVFEDNLVFDEHRLIGTFGLSSVTEFSVPNNIEHIGGSAFASMPSLSAVHISPTVAYIAYGAIGTGVIIYGQSGTAAETYALEQGIEFINATALREPVAVAEITEDALISEIPQDPNSARDYTIFLIIGGSILVIVLIFMVVIIKTRKRK